MREIEHAKGFLPAKLRLDVDRRLGLDGEGDEGEEEEEGGVGVLLTCRERTGSGVGRLRMEMKTTVGEGGGREVFGLREVRSSVGIVGVSSVVASVGVR